jgi:hypothetical protein
MRQQYAGSLLPLDGPAPLRYAVRRGAPAASR